MEAQRRGYRTFAWPLNFDHLRAKIAERHGAVRPREDSCEVKYADSFEGSRGPLLT